MPYISAQQLRRAKLRKSPAKTKGHWPKGKPRNTHTDGKEVRRLLDIAAGKRMQAEVARRLGVPVKTIWRWRTGVHVPSEGMARRIAEIVE